MSYRDPVPIPAMNGVPPAYATKRRLPSRSATNPVKAEELLFYIVLTLLTISGMPETTRAQDFVRNNVYVEGSTSGRLFSINYERRLSPHAVARTGVIIRDPGKRKLGFSTVPVMISLLDGFHRFGRHRLELGTGPLLALVREHSSHVGAMAVSAGFIVAVGYRYQPSKEGILIRIGLTGLFNGGFPDQATHLSLGYAF